MGVTETGNIVCLICGTRNEIIVKKKYFLLWDEYNPTTNITQRCSGCGFKIDIDEYLKSILSETAYEKIKKEITLDTDNKLRHSIPTDPIAAHLCNAPYGFTNSEY